LLRRRIAAGGPDGATLSDVLRFARPAVVAAADERWRTFLSTSPLVAARGCADLHDIRLCWFEPRPLPDDPRLRLDRDGAWDLRTTSALLRAMRTGVLDYAALGRCTTREELEFPLLPAFTRRTFLRGLKGPVLREGDPMLEREFQKALFRLPAAIRPRIRIAVQCAG
jgi:hypothetical protein